MGVAEVVAQLLHFCLYNSLLMYDYCYFIGLLIYVK